MINGIAPFAWILLGAVIVLLPGLVMLLGRLPFVGGLLIGIITVFGVGTSVLALTQPPPVQPNTPASGLPALG